MTTAEYIRQFPVRTFLKGQVILQAGEPSTVLLAIRQGNAKIVRYDSTGSAQLLLIAGKYDVLPSEHLFLLTKPVEFFYEALTNVSAYEIPKNNFLRSARTDLALMTEAAIGMAAHYDDLLARVSAMEQPNVRGRLLATLCYLAERFSADDTVDLYDLGLSLTHQDFADMISSTRETTTLELQGLRSEGCISYSRKAFIIHRAACGEKLEYI